MTNPPGDHPGNPSPTGGDRHTPARTAGGDGLAADRQRILDATAALDPLWVQRLVVELRLREVPGTRLGAILAEAQAHAEAAGETAWEAFGEPEDYAAALAPDDDPELAPRQVFAAVMPAFAALVGLAMVFGSAQPVRTRTPVTVTAGALAQAVLGAVVLVVSVLSLSWVLRRVSRSPRAIWVFGAAGGALSAGLVALAAWRTPVVTVPQLPFFAAGFLVVMVAGLVGRKLLHDATDEIELPGTAPEPASAMPWYASPWTIAMALAVAAAGYAAWPA